jgi:hypothetical protein
MRFYLTFSIFFFAANINCWGQGESKFQIWTDVNPSFNLSEQWRIGGDVGYRIEPSSSVQSVYIRPGINYKPNKIVNFTIGIASTYLWTPDEHIKTEVRTFQFVSVSWPRLGGFQFRHRLGLEQRWFYFAEPNLKEYVNRTRYYLEVKSPNFTLFKLKSQFFITANLEILRDLNNNEFGKLVDHNRYTLGIGNQVTERLRAELRFKLINTIDPLLNSFIREINVLRIRIYFHLNSI